MIKPEICWFVLFYLCIQYSPKYGINLFTVISNDFSTWYYCFFLQQSLQLFLYSWYFCFGCCCCCNYYIGWCCSYALSHALSHSFSQMALLHRSGKHFTVDFISKSPLYFISIALKLLQKIMLCFEKNVKSSVSILWYSWHDTHRVK